MRARSAPSAARIEISFWRSVPRARSRLATLPQAINSTSATAPAKMSSDWRVASGISQSRNVRKRTVQPRLESGNCVASCAAIALSSACACSMVVPALSLPITRSRWSPRARVGSGASGTIRSIVGPSHRNDSGRTPTIVQTAPFNVSVRWSTSGSPPKCRCHNPWVTIATRGSVRGRSSSG